MGEFGSQIKNVSRCVDDPLNFLEQMASKDPLLVYSALSLKGTTVRPYVMEVKSSRVCLPEKLLGIIDRKHIQEVRRGKTKTRFYQLSKGKLICLGMFTWPNDTSAYTGKKRKLSSKCVRCPKQHVAFRFSLNQTICPWLYGKMSKIVVFVFTLFIIHFKKKKSYQKDFNFFFYIQE